MTRMRLFPGRSAASEFLADLNAIAVFVAVARFESFGRRMPVSTLCRKVTALEELDGSGGCYSQYYLDNYLRW